MGCGLFATGWCLQFLAAPVPFCHFYYRSVVYFGMIGMFSWLPDMHELFAGRLFFYLLLFELD